MYVIIIIKKFVICIVLIIYIKFYKCCLWLGKIRLFLRDKLRIVYKLLKNNF